VHEILGLQRRPGLTDHLIASHDPKASLERDRASGCRVLTAGTPALNGGRLLGSAKMERLIDALKTEFDTIIIDSPPVMSVAATLTLGRLADQTIVVIRWEKTRREVVLTAIRELAKARARIVGVVLTQVNPKRLASYSYSDGAYSDYAVDYRKV
jgi:Mrp family chromosome partitioning ATPase